MIQPLTDDRLATVLITTGLAMPRSGDLRPFAAGDWATLVRALVARDATPGRLLGSTGEQLRREFDLDQSMSDRIARLLDRAGPAAIELQRLADLGIWCLTKLDEAYPERLKQRLHSSQSPPVMFGAGAVELLAKDGIAIVGSRNVDESGLEFAQQLGMRCADEGMNAVSGGARGVDRAAMMGALDTGGTAIGVLADSLEKTIRARDVRQFLLDGQLVLVSAALPADGFAVGRAMERNKYIYCLAEYSIVVATDAGTGGTWAGAVENLRRDWGIPLFVRSGPASPPGNAQLLAYDTKEARSPLPIGSVPGRHELADWMLERVVEQAADGTKASGDGMSRKASQLHLMPTE